MKRFLFLLNYFIDQCSVFFECQLLVIIDLDSYLSLSFDYLGFVKKLFDVRMLNYLQHT
jgi:hypothetical protein